MRAFRLLGSDLSLLQVQGLLNQNATLTWLNVRYHNCCARKGVRYLKYNCNYIYIYIYVCVFWHVLHFRFPFCWAARSFHSLQVLVSIDDTRLIHCSRTSRCVHGVRLRVFCFWNTIQQEKAPALTMPRFVKCAMG